MKVAVKVCRFFRLTGALPVNDDAKRIVRIIGDETGLILSEDWGPAAGRPVTPHAEAVLRAFDRAAWSGENFISEFEGSFEPEDTGVSIDLPGETLAEALRLRTKEYSQAFSGLVAVLNEEAKRPENKMAFAALYGD